MRSARHRRAAAVLAAATLVVVAACGDDDDETAAGSGTTVSTEPQPVDSASLQELYGQTPAWDACAENPAFQCTGVTVPLDYGDPDGEKIRLAVNKLPASGSARRIGSLVVNPGGPGGSGVDFAFGAEQWASPEILAAYDIVGLDPRGVARSSPIACMDDHERDEYYATGLVASSDSEERELQRAAASYARACESASGDLLPYVGTENVVADMDVLRAVLGDEKLHYFGISYGTLLGQHYAGTFPDTVGRMALDSVMNPALSTSQIVVDNAESFDAVYDAFLEQCTGSDCPLGATVQAARDATEALVAQADRVPLPVPDQPDRPVTDADVRVALSDAMMATEKWPVLAEALAATQAGDGTGLRALADDARGYDAEAAAYDNSDLAHTAVVCLWTSREQRSVGTGDDAIDDATERSALFGPLDYFRPCTTWSAPATLTPQKIEAKGTPPILLLNNTRDPSTPLWWAEAVEKQLDDAVLLRNEGDGHGALMKNRCVYDALQQYLLEGTTPEEGTTCQDEGDSRS